MKKEQRSPGKSRPAIFRALGRRDVPPTVTIDGHEYHLEKVFKHDSWAATALYEGHDGKIVCKFNRQQSIFLLLSSLCESRTAEQH